MQVAPNENESVTAYTWRLGRAYGYSNKQIKEKGTWKKLYQEAWQELSGKAKDGIEKIFNELENTIKTYTKSPKTEQAEMNSLDNIRAIVKQAISQAGYQAAFDALADIYDNGAGEWIQRIIAAIYDKELAQWSDGLPRYMDKLKTEITDKMSASIGEKIRTQDIDFNTNVLDDNFVMTEENWEEYERIFDEANNNMNVDELIKLTFGE